MTTEMDPPYCLVYPKIFKPSIPQMECSHYNSKGAPSHGRIHKCMCCTLLHCIDHTHLQQQKHHQGQLVICWRAQYSCLLPSVAIPCNHHPPIVQFGGEMTFPMASVRDFTLDDKLFPGSPGNSLLYNDKEIMELQRQGYQVSLHRAHEDDSTPWHPDKTDPAFSDGDSSKTVGTLNRKCA